MASALHEWKRNYWAHWLPRTDRYACVTYCTCNSVTQQQKTCSGIACRSQWSSGSMLHCSVRGVRFESQHRQLCLSQQPLHIQPWAWAVPLTAVPRSTQPSTIHRTVKWVPAYGLSNNNKWWWWMWMIAAYWQTQRPTWLAWFEGWWPSGTQSAFI